MKKNRKTFSLMSRTFIVLLALVYIAVGTSQTARAVSRSYVADDGKIVSAQGTGVTEELEQQIGEFIDEVNNVQGFAIYANTLDRTNHVEGNIFVNDVTSGGVNIVVNGVSEVTSTDYSYIGTSNGGIQISDSSNITVGSQIDVQTPNQNQTILNGGYSNNISVTQLNEEDGNTLRADLQNNLTNIANAGASLINNPDNSFYGSSNDAFESVNSMLEDGTLQKGDAVLINVSYNDLLFNEGAFGNLINNNQGTTVIINVVCDDSVESINIGKGFSANTKVATSFNPYSPYVIWNFGDYTGDINICEEMVGIIVAPQGRVYQAAGNLNGAIIANVAGNNGEIHQVSKTYEPEPTDPEPTDPEPTDPEPTDPEPTDPEPTDPEPTDPEPTDPEPTDPEPTDPEPTNPEPTDPEPTDPEPTDPEPTDPEPTDPEPTDPEPTDPEPTDPEPTDPEPTDPEPTDPEPTDPEPTNPEPTDPEPTDPEPTDPEPTDPEPTDPEPTNPEPTDPEPTDPEPTDPEPTDPEPTDPEPTDPEPTDPEPTDPEPTDPEPTDPEPTDPEPTDPEPTDPEPTDPEPTNPDSTPTPNNPEPEKPQPVQYVPRTGDESNLMPYMAMMVLSVVGMVTIICYQKKKVRVR